MMKYSIRFKPRGVRFESNWVASEPISIKKIISGKELEIIGHEVLCTTLDGIGFTCRITSKVDGKRVSRKELYKLFGKEVT